MRNYEMTTSAPLFETTVTEYLHEDESPVYMIELYKAKDGWRWRIKAGNGEILAHSEAYKKKYNAVQTLQKVSKAKFVIKEK